MINHLMHCLHVLNYRTTTLLIDKSVWEFLWKKSLNYLIPASLLWIFSDSSFMYWVQMFSFDQMSKYNRKKQVQTMLVGFQLAKDPIPPHSHVFWLKQLGSYWPHVPWQPWLSCTESPPPQTAGRHRGWWPPLVCLLRDSAPLHHLRPEPALRYISTCGESNRLAPLGPSCAGSAGWCPSSGPCFLWQQPQQCTGSMTPCKKTLSFQQILSGNMRSQISRNTTLGTNLLIIDSCLNIRMLKNAF